MRDQPIFLPVAMLAEMLGCDRTMVSNYFKLAKRDGILREVSTWSYTEHKAKEYRFTLESWDWTTGRQTAGNAENVMRPSPNQTHSGAGPRHPSGEGCQSSSGEDSHQEHQNIKAAVVSDAPDAPDENGAQRPRKRRYALVATEAQIAKARARGEKHGFNGTFLIAFIEREVRLMEKWARTEARRRAREYEGRPEAADYQMWGGRFRRKGEA
jgi:hypothetical protein